ncbi:hypothetical protein DUNSADRAFT_6845 [Dunaliella salina]|uniref:Enkurin domain-containing protein n=1 Tax=Dunaliella salina TaxID=3046 RepID=A0ABQ7GMH7_DUNSA|nr:hypothetical protein DUNSADRAFT_6845 [Dunaliella salina]|eukprot:KAF5835811.1 hypothetical protein DUNSADRAFT_6845 [Dunaliella salina]
MAELEHQPAPNTVEQDCREHLWKELGRDTPAGKALFKLYGGNKMGTNAGNTYDEANRKKMEAKIAAGWTPPPKAAPPPPVRPTVNVPTFGRPKFQMPAPVEMIPHRRPATKILRELEEEMERQRSQRPTPKGPLLDDKEKERFALMMRYRGKPPVATEKELEGCRMHRGQTQRKSGLQELQQMFDQVALEIEERRKFLEDLEAHGALKRETQHQVRWEIQQRVQDLAKLDQMISDYGTGKT